MSRLAIEQAFPTLVDVDLVAPNMAERIPTFDREFPLHSCHCPTAASSSKKMAMDPPWLTSPD
jgi:hypothetical protein